MRSIKFFILVVLMLVIMGERWEFIGSTSSLYIFQGSDIISVNRLYQRVYVIGERTPRNVFCPGAMCPVSAEERFTIPIPDAPLKTMTSEEAARLNKELMR